MAERLALGSRRHTAGFAVQPTPCRYNRGRRVALDVATGLVGWLRSGGRGGSTVPGYVQLRGCRRKEVSHHIPYRNSAQAYLHHRRVLHLVSPRTVAGVFAPWPARLVHHVNATCQAHRPCWPTSCSWAPLAAAQDLKPHNILLGRHGEAKIGDVGFSRQGRGSESR